MFRLHHKNQLLYSNLSNSIITLPNNHSLKRRLQEAAVGARQTGQFGLKLAVCTKTEFYKRIIAYRKNDNLVYQRRAN